MGRRTKIIALVVASAVIGGTAYWLLRPRSIPTSPPASAPKVNSCWQVDVEAAHRMMPWAGAAVDCAAPHTAEVFQVSRVSHRLRTP